MIYCENLSAAAASVDDHCVFVSQMNKAGIPVRILSSSFTASLPQGSAYDMAPYVGGSEIEEGDSLLLIATHEMTDQALVRLRRLARGRPFRAVAIGCFANRQAEISAKARISYVLGEAPDIVDLSDRGIARLRAPILGVASKTNSVGRIKLLMIEPDLANSAEGRALLSFAHSPRFEVSVLTSGDKKKAWIERNGTSIPIYNYSEVPAAALTRGASVCVTFRGPSQNYRTCCLMANLLVSGCVMIDSSQKLLNAAADETFLRGPGRISDLDAFLVSTVLPHMDEISAEVRASAVRSRLDRGSALSALEELIPDLTAPPVVSAAEPERRGVMFLPTNGVGLGHAQRCSLIASEIRDDEFKPRFAAFPSCIRMLRNYGFDTMPLISRSGHHGRDFDNDLVNFARVLPEVRASRAFVFDGGYVFGSIFRSALETGVPTVWVRRGMWQAGQNNTPALDREKAFERVIVPQEAFEELNARYSAGSRVREVGPIVQISRSTPRKRKELRSALRRRFGKDFDQLVVTMLGGGVAADRSAQIAALAATFEAQPRVLHLVVVWPTATVEPSAYGWKNTKVVRTHHAHGLVAAADLFVSATGYNSFHEAIYNGVPTIFIPQMAAYMDDQRARATAAADRGLASVVEPTQILGLSDEVRLYLEGKAVEIREKLAAVDLPAPGNADAARLIQEICQ